MKIGIPPALFLVALAIHGCAGGRELLIADEAEGFFREENQVKTLTIRWQRLVSEGQTCPRCGTTEEELQKAVHTLRKSLFPLGIQVVLEKAELSLAEFQENPLDSNQILLNGRPLEAWVGGESGQSPCCDVCGPSDCRTVGVGGKTYETIPAELIVKAGLQAASLLVGQEPDKSGCCPK